MKKEHSKEYRSSDAREARIHLQVEEGTKKKREIERASERDYNGYVSVSSCCYNKLPQTLWPKTYLLSSDSGDQKSEISFNGLKSRYQLYYIPSGGRNLFPYHFHLLEDAYTPWLAAPFFILIARRVSSSVLSDLCFHLIYFEPLK